MNFDYRVIALLFADGVLNWLQNIIAFSVLSLVTPLTYAVASASKRIFVIAASLLVLGNPVTWLNCCGMTLAIIGVLCYNKAKQMTRHSSLLPTMSKSNGINYKPLLSDKTTVDSYYMGNRSTPNTTGTFYSYNSRSHANAMAKTASHGGLLFSSSNGLPKSQASILLSH